MIFGKIARGVAREIEVFRGLGKNAKDLFRSLIYFNAADLLLSIFINAYIWGETQDIVAVAVFNMAIMVLLPIFFLINYKLLGRFKIKHLYMLGLLLIAVSGLTVVPISQIGWGLWGYALIGAIHGIAGGFFWGNRNYLVISSTSKGQRDYFIGLESTIFTFAGLVLPVLAGVFIVNLAPQLGITRDMSYGILMLAGAFGFTLACLELVDNKFPEPPNASLDRRAFRISGYTTQWQLTRLLNIFYGMPQGLLFFIPTLLVLIFLGGEDTLGYVEAIGTLVAAIGIYLAARFSNLERRRYLVLIGALILTVISIVFGVFYSAVAALIYVFFIKLNPAFIDNPIEAFWFDAIDSDGNYEGQDFRYLIDIELFINIGRVIGILLFILCIYLVGQDTALRILIFILPLAYLVMTGLLFMINKLAFKDESKA